MKREKKKEVPIRNEGEEVEYIGYLFRWAGLLEARMMDRSSVEHGVWAADDTEFSSVVMSLNATGGEQTSPRRVLDS